MGLTVPALLAALQALVSNSQQHNGRHLSLAAIVADLRLVDKGRLPGCIEAEEVSGVASECQCHVHNG